MHFRSFVFRNNAAITLNIRNEGLLSMCIFWIGRESCNNEYVTSVCAPNCKPPLCLQGAPTCSVHCIYELKHIVFFFSTFAL